MAFNDDKSPGDLIKSQDWDDFVNFTELISSASYGHSSNSELHFTKTSIDDDYAGSSQIRQYIGVVSGNLSNRINSKSLISGLTDVAEMTGRSDGDVLTWDTTQSKWSSQAAQEASTIGWKSFTAADGSIGGMTGTYSVSGTGDLSISVPGYSTISSQAKQGYDFSSASDSFDHEQYITSSNIINRFVESGGIHNSFSSQSISSNNIYTNDVHMHRWTLSDSENRYHTLNDLFILFNSAGRISGGTIYSSQTEGGRFSISGGQGLLRSSDNDYAPLYFIQWDTSSQIYVATGSTKYVGVKYNSGTPVAFAQDTDTWDLDTNFSLGSVCNRSGQLCILSNPWWVSDGITNIIERFDSLGTIVRDTKQGGLILSESGDNNRYISITAGKLWSRLNEFDISAFDTETGSKFIIAYRDGASGWIIQNNQTQWPNNKFDNNSGTLQSVANNKYANIWFYQLATGIVMMLYDQIASAYNTAAGAEAGSPPGSLPDCITEHGILIGRIIFEGTQTIATAVQSAFDTIFSPTQAADHGNLGGLSDDDHTHYYNQTRIATISSQAKYAHDEVKASGTEYSNSYQWYTESSSKISEFVASGDEYTQAYNWVNNSGSRYEELLASGTKYSDAYHWVNASGERYDNLLESGAKYTAVYNWYNLSSNKLHEILSSGNEYSTVYTWYTESSSKISSFILSGNEYSTNYDWYNTYHSQFDNLLASGEQYTEVHTWYSESAQKISTISGSLSDRINALGAFDAETYMTSANIIANYAKSTNLYNRDWIDALSGSIDGRIDALGSFDPEDYMTSANILANYAKSTNLYNTVWIDAFSGNIDDRIDTLEGYDQFDHELYITSSNLLSTFANSTNINSRFVGSSTAIAKYMQSTAALTNFPGSSAIISRYVHSGVILASVSSQFLSGQLKAIHTAGDISSWDPANWHNSSLMWNNDSSLWIPKPSSASQGSSTLDDLTDTLLTTPASGEVLVYKQNNSRWENELPAMTFNVANVKISSNYNLNLTRFDAGAKNVYIWQAAACNSGGASVSGLSIELLSGSTSVYSTSSAIIQQGYPLARSNGGNTEIRFKYSGQNSLTGAQFGTAFMQISVY